MSIALATSSTGVTPTKAGQSVGQIINVTNHLGLESAGLAKRCTVEDLSRLVWLWEWDGTTMPSSMDTSAIAQLEDDNPFIVPSKDWTRGGMGLVLTPTTHFSRASGKRTPAYGIGIEVDAAGKQGRISAVARWTSVAENRRNEMASRLAKWVEVYFQCPDNSTHTQLSFH